MIFITKMLYDKKLCKHMLELRIICRHPVRKKAAGVFTHWTSPAEAFVAAQI